MVARTRREKAMRITKIDALPKLEKELRVAAYCRVSSGKDAMLHSLSSQVSYYNNLIRNTKGWRFAGVYADEAISGTKDEREGFKKLIDDCRAGKIDLIIVKAISRFARNTLTMLETIRELKNLGVDVFFEEQNLHSISSEGEMVLTFLASFAQEEARSVSENMKWRVRKNFEKGEAWSTRKTLGYVYKDRKMIVEPEEAKLVRRIFGMYVNGLGIQGIANKLNAENVKPPESNKWKKDSVRYILTNISYTGDLLLQKFYNVDYMSKKSKRNKGEKDKYLVEGDHEPIVSKETFERVQELMYERAVYANTSRTAQIPHPLASRVKCSICGKSYHHKTTKYTKKWQCQTFNMEGKSHCASKSVPASEMDRLVEEVVGEDISKIREIIVHPNNTLKFNLKDGSSIEKKWNDISRRDSWTEEMKEAARQRALKQHEAKRKEGR